MATFAELQAEIATEIKQTTSGSFAAQIRQAINDAIEAYQEKTFFFNQGTDSVTTVADQQAYDLPDDLLIIDEIQFFWGGNNFTTMEKRDWRWFLDVNQASGTLRSTPSSYYAIRGQQIFIYPTPATDQFRLDFYYIKRLLPFPLVEDDATNAWLSEGRQLIRAYAKHLLYLHVVQQADHALVMEEQAKKALLRLQRAASENLGSRGLVPMEL